MMDAKDTGSHIPLLIDSKPAPTAPIIVPLEPTKDDTFVQIQEGVTFVPYKHCCGCTRSPNIVGFFFNFLIWISTLLLLGFLIAFIFEKELKDTPYGGFFLSIPPPIFLGIWAGIYLFYLIDVFCTNSCKYLKNMDFVEDFVGHVERIKKVAPTIGFWCECYHYETRTRTVHYTDSEGKSQTRTETYEEKVVTHTETEYFTYQNFDDISGHVTNDILVFIATKVKFSKAWSCGDDRTRQLYELAHFNFIERNKYRDSHFSSSNVFRVDGFHERKLCLVELSKRSNIMSYAHYLIYSLCLLCSWPYRMWLENKTVRSRYHFQKRIYAY